MKKLLTFTFSLLFVLFSSLEINALSNEFSDWNNVGGNKTNSKVIYSKTPKKVSDIKETALIKGRYREVIVIGDYFYAANTEKSGNATLEKFDLDGNSIKEYQLSDKIGFFSRMTYDGQGVIYINMEKCVEAFDINNGKSLWSSEKSSKQMLSQLIYHDGFLYGGVSTNPSAGTEPSNGYYFAIDTVNGKITNNVKEYAWTWGKDSAVKDKGFYWDGAAIVKDAVVFVGDGGYVISHHLKKPFIYDEYKLKSDNPKDAHKVRSLVHYNRLKDELLIGTQNSKKLFKIPLEKDTHKFNKSEIKMVAVPDQISGGINRSMNDGGNLYLSSGGMFANHFTIYNPETLDKKYDTKEYGTQSFPLINSSKVDGYEYIYFMDYKTGELVIAKYDGTNAPTFEKFNTNTAKNNSGSVVAANDGTLIISKHDGGNIAILKNKDSSYTQAEIDKLALNLPDKEKVTYFDKEQVYNVNNYMEQISYTNNKIIELKTKIDDLTNERVNQLVNDIDSINIDSSEANKKIDKALSDYGLLYEEDKAKITNYSDLLNKKDKLDDKYSSELIERIKKLPSNVSLKDEEEVKDIYSLYQAISDEAKAEVINYDEFSVKYKKIIEVRALVDDINSSIKGIPNDLIEQDYEILIGIKNKYNKLERINQSFVEGYEFVLESLAKLNSKTSTIHKGSDTYYYRFLNGIWHNYRIDEVRTSRGVKTTTRYDYNFSSKKVRSNQKVVRNGSVLKKKRVKGVKGYRIISEQTYNYNSREQLINAVSYKNNRKNYLIRTYYQTRSYYSNGKLSNHYVYQRNLNTNKMSSKSRTFYNSNGKLNRKVIFKYNRYGKYSKRYEYDYNRAGQLRSNKYGKAYRYTTSYSKRGKALKTYRNQYTSKAKLVKRSIKVSKRNNF